MLKLLQRGSAASGTAERRAPGKWCRIQAYAAYSVVVSDCLLNETVKQCFLMSLTT